MAGLDFSTLRRSRFGVVVDALDRKLLEQFFVTLDATLKQLVPREGAPAGQQAIVAEAARLLSGAPSWRTAYHVEQLMVPLFAGPALEVELRRRLLELRKFDSADFQLLTDGPDCCSFTLVQYWFGKRHFQQQPDKQTTVLGATGAMLAQVLKCCQQ